MHANAVECLLTFLQSGAEVLDVGSGSSYLTHVLAELVQPGGSLVAVNYIPALAELSIQNTRKRAVGRKLMEIGALDRREDCVVLYMSELRRGSWDDREG